MTSWHERQLMMRSYANSELTWRGDRLALKSGSRASPAVEIVPDDSYPNMWRIRKQDGSLSEMVNRTRARDAARSILIGILNAQETASGGPPMRSAA
jgi:hypothetical protein